MRHASLFRVSAMALRFLVADDNAAHQCLMASVVMTLGGSAVRAATGVQVLKRTVGERFDFIILDLGMRNMDGFMTASKLLDEYADLKERPRVIAVASAASPERRSLCRAIGMD